VAAARAWRLVQLPALAGALVLFSCAPSGMMNEAQTTTSPAPRTEPVIHDPLAHCAAAQAPIGQGSPLKISAGTGAAGVPDGDDGCLDEACGEVGGAEGGGSSEWLTDGPYDPARGFGWLGELDTESYSEIDLWYADIFPLGTSCALNPHSDLGAYHRRIEPYRSWVRDLSAYRVDRPNGLYRVTLLFMEPDFPEAGLRIFDLSTGARALIENLDLAARAGQDELVAIALQVEAVDGHILLDFTPRSAVPPLLSGLIVEPAAPATPPAPIGLEARAGLEEVLLRWDLPPSPARGWLVERSIEGGPFAPASARLLLTPDFVDRQRTPGASLRYRVATVDASCAVGEAVESPPVTPISPQAFGLPVIDLEVAAEDLHAMHLDPQARLAVPVTVKRGAETASGSIRLRGSSTLWLAKRSYRIQLDQGQIDGRDRIKLLAEVGDLTRLQQLLSFDLLERMATLAPRARPVLVRINGEVRGVYNDVEHVGDAFLRARGYQVDDRFRIGAANFALQLDVHGALSLEAYEKKENESEPSPELEALLRWLHGAAEHEVEAELGAYVDVPAFVDYLAGQTLIANWEVVDGNHYLALDPASGRFLMIPWDLNNKTWTRWELPLANSTLFEVGAEPSPWEVNWLWTRAVASPGFRAALADRLERALGAEYGADTDAAIDARFAEIEPALAVEPWLWRRRYEALFTTGRSQIRSFVTERRSFIARELQRLRGLADQAVVLTEIDPGQGGAGRVALENRGAVSADLGDCWITDDPMQPRRQPIVTPSPVAPGARLEIAMSEAVLSPTGGFVGLWCGAAGAELPESDGPLGGRRGFTSPVYYPHLPASHAYARTGQDWAPQAR